MNNYVSVTPPWAAQVKKGAPGFEVDRDHGQGWHVCLSNCPCSLTMPGTRGFEQARDVLMGMWHKGVKAQTRSK
jgi:hypothetical protein